MRWKGSKKGREIHSWNPRSILGFHLHLEFVRKHYQCKWFSSSVWSGTSKSNIAKLQLVQNFAARLLPGKRKYEHITPTLKELKLLPVSETFRLRDAIQMFKCMNNQAPRYLVNMFQDIWNSSITQGLTTTLTSLCAARHWHNNHLPTEGP